MAAVALAACAGSSPTPEFTGDSAWKYLLQQCEYGPRVPNSAAHDSTVVMIARALEGSGAIVSLQRFEVDDPYSDRTLKLTNVIGSFSPEQSERVLVSAHFDCRPWADQEEDSTLHDQPVPGANDGASGVGILLELAEMIGRQAPEAVGVDLVFFDGEDYGKEGDYGNYLLGSQHFAANLAGYRPDYGILLDIVGGIDAKIGREGNSQAYATALNDTLFARAAALGLTVFVDEDRPPILDDHIPLLRAGIPTVDLIGLPYDHWHLTTDTPDKCSQETLRQVGALVVDFLYNYPF